MERQILEDLCKMFKKDRTGMKAFVDKLLITVMAKGFTKFQRLCDQSKKLWFKKYSVTPKVVVTSKWCIKFLKLLQKYIECLKISYKFEN